MEINNIITILKKMNNKPNEGVILSDLVEKSISMILSDSFDEALNSVALVNNKEDKINVYVKFAMQYGVALTSIGIYNTPIVLKHLNDRYTSIENKVVKNLLKGVLEWIIPNKELRSIINTIKNKDGFTFDEESTYERLFTYIGVKIQIVIIESLRLNFPLSIEQSELNLVIKEMVNVNRRTKKRNELDDFLDIMKSIIEPELEKINDAPKSLITFYQNMNSREIDDLLIPIYKDCLIEISPKTVLRNTKQIKQEKEKLRLAYPLFALVLKEKSWDSKQYMYGNKKGKPDYRQQDQDLRKFIYKI